MKTGIVINSDGTRLMSSIKVPVTFYQRAKGLLGAKNIGIDEGMFFKNCSSIHMIGMRISLDIVFLNKQFEIVKLVEQLKPYQVSACWNAAHVLEMSLGSINRHQFKIGTKLLVEEV